MASLAAGISYLFHVPLSQRRIYSFSKPSSHKIYESRKAWIHLTIIWIHATENLDYIIIHYITIVKPSQLILTTWNSVNVGNFIGEMLANYLQLSYTFLPKWNKSLKQNYQMIFFWYSNNVLLEPEFHKDKLFVWKGWNPIHL